MSDLDPVPTSPELPAACGWCSEPLLGDHERTCAGCGGRYHRDCASRAGRCADDTCAQARPSHPAWTVEAREEGWLLVPTPPASPWLRRLMLLAALPIAGRPEKETIRDLGKDLISAGGIEPWMMISIAVGISLAPWAALVVLVALEQATQRGALIDTHGLLFDHSPTWRGARLTWDSMLGYRISEAGVRLIVRGRPWTRFVGPTIPCAGKLLHDVVEVLERRGVRRFDS